MKPSPALGARGVSLRVTDTLAALVPALDALEKLLWAPGGMTLALPALEAREAILLAPEVLPLLLPALAARGDSPRYVERSAWVSAMRWLIFLPIPKISLWSFFGPSWASRLGSLPVRPV